MNHALSQRAKRRRLSTWLAAMLIATGGLIGSPHPAAVRGDTGASGRLELTTTRAVVFKDGYGLIMREARGIADDDGWVHTLDVPDTAVLGSFWAVSHLGDVVAMRAEYANEWKRQAQPRGPGSMALAALLQQAQGKAVSLVLEDGAMVSGKALEQVVIDDQPCVLVMPSEPSDDRRATVAVALSDITSVSIATSPGAHGGNVPFVRAKRLSFHLGAEAAGQAAQLTLMYFTPGLRWIPTYRLDGELIDTGRLALQAEILNEHADLHDVALDLVVGVPHLRFREVISPLSLEATLRNTLAQAAPQLMGQMSNAAFTPQRMGERQYRPAPGPGDVQLPAELTATGEQDLFVYSVPKFSLDQGGRASVPLWQAGVGMEHMYTLDLPITRDAQHGSMVVGPLSDAARPADSPLRLMTTQVWHQLNLHNESNVPWTTGAAMIMRGNLPVGQDLLTYTPPGGSTLLPMTVAVNLRGSLREEETNRELNVLTWDNDKYSRITKTGTITIKSYRGETSQVRVTAQVPGLVTEASNDAKLMIDDVRPSDWHGRGFWQNNHTEVTWNLSLDPGEEVRLTYTVQFYVR